MTDDKKTNDTTGAEATEQDEKKLRRATVKRAETRADSATVTIRGRVSTVLLRAGDEVTVERTQQIEALLTAGFVTEVKEK